MDLIELIHPGMTSEEIFLVEERHLATAGYAASAMPFQIFLLAMLLEEHKQVMHLRNMIEDQPNP